MYTKYTSEYFIKDDVLLSKQFVLSYYLNYTLSKIVLLIKSKMVLKLSKYCEQKFYRLYLSFFFFFGNLVKLFKIIKGNQKNILFLQLPFNSFSTTNLLSNYYYYSIFEEVGAMSKVKINFEQKVIFVKSSFIFLQMFLDIYILKDKIIDIAEINYLVQFEHELS